MALFETKKSMNDLVLAHTPDLKRVMQGYSLIMDSRVWKPMGAETKQQVGVTLKTFLSKDETIGADGREFVDPVYVGERCFSIPIGSITSGDIAASLYPWVEYDIVRSALLAKHAAEDKSAPLVADEKIKNEEKRATDLSQREAARTKARADELKAARAYFLPEASDDV